MSSTADLGASMDIDEAAIDEGLYSRQLCVQVITICFKAFINQIQIDMFSGTKVLDYSYTCGDYQC
jgi:hypothetical protein